MRRGRLILERSFSPHSFHPLRFDFLFGRWFRYDGGEDGMSKRELAAHELNAISEEDLDALLSFLQSLKARHGGHVSPALLAESSLAKDWLTPQEEAAWEDL